MRLIDADQMAADESEAYMSAQTKINGFALLQVNAVVHKKIQMLIADTPSVDAVPVVRCKDCKYYRIGEYFPDIRFCFQKLDKDRKPIGYNVPDDGFCHNGKRRDEE